MSVPATWVPIGHNESGVNSIHYKPDMRKDLSNNFQSTMVAIRTTPCGNNAHMTVGKNRIILDTSISSVATKRWREGLLFSFELHWWLYHQLSAKGLWPGPSHNARACGGCKMRENGHGNPCGNLLRMSGSLPALMRLSLAERLKPNTKEEATPAGNKGNVRGGLH